MILGHTDCNEHGHGVGGEILGCGAYGGLETSLLVAFAHKRRESHGDGVVAIDGGANIGAMTLELGRHMTGWGSVLAIEPQERIFYCLCGNIALGNLFNVRAIHGALTGRNEDSILVPVVDYRLPANFGGLGLRSDKRTDRYPVRAYKLDDLAGDRCDLLKLDIEGMEVEVLAAADRTLRMLRPVIWAETNICGQDEFSGLLTARGYTVKHHGNMSLAVPD